MTRLFKFSRLKIFYGSSDINFLRQLMFCCIDAFSSSIVVQLPAAISGSISIKRVHWVSLRRPSGPFRLLIDCRGMPGPLIPLSSAATCYRVRPHINDALIPSQINRLAAGHAHTHTHEPRPSFDEEIISLSLSDALGSSRPLPSARPPKVWEHLIRINRVRELNMFGLFLEKVGASSRVFFVGSARTPTDGKQPRATSKRPLVTWPPAVTPLSPFSSLFWFYATFASWMTLSDGVSSSGQLFSAQSARLVGTQRRRVQACSGGARGGASPKWKIKTKIYDKNFQEVFFSPSIPSVLSLLNYCFECGLEINSDLIWIN